MPIWWGIAYQVPSRLICQPVAVLSSLPPFTLPSSCDLTNLPPPLSEICSPNSLVHSSTPSMKISVFPCLPYACNLQNVDLKAVGSWIMGRRTPYKTLRYHLILSYSTILSKLFLIWFAAFKLPTTKVDFPFVL